MNMIYCNSQAVVVWYLDILHIKDVRISSLQEWNFKNAPVVTVGLSAALLCFRFWTQMRLVSQGSSEMLVRLHLYLLFSDSGLSFQASHWPDCRIGSVAMAPLWHRCFSVKPRASCCSWSQIAFSFCLDCADAHAHTSSLKQTGVSVSVASNSLKTLTSGVPFVWQAFACMHSGLLSKLLWKTSLAENVTSLFFSERS